MVLHGNASGEAIRVSTGNVWLIPSNGGGKAPSAGAGKTVCIGIKSKEDSPEFKAQCLQVHQGLPTGLRSNLKDPIPSQSVPLF